MNEAIRTFHLTQARLDGPAERTLVEPWLTEMSNLALNAYAEVPPVAAPRTLAVVEALPATAARPPGRSRVALAA